MFPSHHSASQFRILFLPLITLTQSPSEVLQARYQNAHDDAMSLLEMFAHYQSQLEASENQVRDRDRTIASHEDTVKTLQKQLAIATEEIAQTKDKLAYAEQEIATLSCYADMYIAPDIANAAGIINLHAIGHNDQPVSVDHNGLRRDAVIGANAAHSNAIPGLPIENSVMAHFISNCKYLNHSSGVSD